jgi:hypothetical protein
MNAAGTQPKLTSGVSSSSAGRSAAGQPLLNAALHPAAAKGN